MSTNRVSRDAGWVSTKRLPKGPNGRSLCRQCGQEVPKGRRSFCGDECVDAWVVKTNPARMREIVFKRDQGVCAICRLDTKVLQQEFRDLCRELGVDPTAYALHGEAKQWLRRRGIPQHRRGGFWDADHIVPVIEGGGECSIDNIRTLCIPCHKRATAELATRRAEQRAAEHAAGRPKQRNMRWPG